jgi:hypothetical protein
MRMIKANTAKWLFYWSLVVFMLTAGCGHVTPTSFGSGAGGSATSKIEFAQQFMVVAKGRAKANGDQWEMDYVAAVSRALTDARADVGKLTERCSKAEQKLVEMNDWWFGPALWRNFWRVVIGVGAYVVLTFTLLNITLTKPVGKMLYNPLLWTVKGIGWLIMLPFASKAKTA